MQFALLFSFLASTSVGVVAQCPLTKSEYPKVKLPYGTVQATSCDSTLNVRSSLNHMPKLIFPLFSSTRFPISSLDRTLELTGRDSSLLPFPQLLPTRPSISSIKVPVTLVRSSSYHLQNPIASHFSLAAQILESPFSRHLIAFRNRRIASSLTSMHQLLRYPTCLIFPSWSGSMVAHTLSGQKTRAC
jgi:hypothetical protein